MSTGFQNIRGNFLCKATIVAMCLVVVIFGNIEKVGADEGKNSVTFNADIAPIIHNKCAMCHRPGQVGPFSLLTFKDVKRSAQTIEAVIDSGYMPPWKPVNHNVEFANDRRLSKQQQEKISRWIKAGMPEGDGPKAEVPQFPDDWMLGKPDLVVTMQGEFKVPASGPDVYRSFVFPLDLAEDKWVKAVELKPNAKSSVHHALFFVDTGGNARMMDGSDGKAGISGMGFLAGGGGDERGAGGRAFRVGSALAQGLGAYVPGSFPTKLPGDLAMHLPAGSDVVMQTHFHPAGKAETENAQLALYFADKPPSKKLVPIQVPPMFGFGMGINVPPGKKDYTVSDRFEIPIDIEAISVGGHAHYICRHMSMIATLPDGRSIDLMKIEDWDLDWQDRYYFKEPLKLPAGTVLNTKLVYDNSEDNPENPNQPPKTIRWGRQSDDEMGSVTLQVVAAHASQTVQLEQATRQHMVASVTNRFRRNGVASFLMQLDSNKDGKLQKSESPPRLAESFELLDRNKDGGLDRNELQVVSLFIRRLQRDDD